MYEAYRLRSLNWLTLDYLYLSPQQSLTSTEDREIENLGLSPIRYCIIVNLHTYSLYLPPRVVGKKHTIQCNQRHSLS